MFSDNVYDNQTTFSSKLDIKTIVVISFIAPDFSMYPAMIL